MNEFRLESVYDYCSMLAKLIFVADGIARKGKDGGRFKFQYGMWRDILGM
jgi:hypothetical protein